MKIIRRYLFFLPFVLVPIISYEGDYFWSKIFVGFISLIAVYFFQFKNFIRGGYNNRLVFFSLSFFILAFSSFFWCESYSEYLKSVPLFFFCFLYFLFPLLSDFNFPDFLSAVVFTVFLVSIYGFLQVFGLVSSSVNMFGNLSYGSFFGLSNYSMEYLVLVLPLILKRDRKFMFVSVLALLYMFIAGNKATYLGISIAVAYLFIQNKRIFYVVLFVILFVVPLTLYSLSHSDSYYFRLELWKQALLVAKDNLFLGVGLGNFQTVRWIYNTEKLDVIASSIGMGTGPTHNDFLSILSELGLLGFVLFLMILYKVLTTPNCERRIKSGLFGLLPFMLFHYPLYDIGSAPLFWLFIGTLARPKKGEEREEGNNILKILASASIVISCFIVSIYSFNSLVGEIYLQRARENRSVSEVSKYWYFRSITKDPTSKSPYFDLAVLFYIEKDFELSEKFFEDYEKMAPYDGWAKRFFGEVLFLQKKYDKSFIKFEDAERYSPSARAEIYAYLSAISKERGDIEKAKEYAQRARNKLFGTSDVLFQKGVVTYDKVLHLIGELE